jgi:hypothetical protein
MNPPVPQIHPQFLKGGGREQWEKEEKETGIFKKSNWVK